VSVGLSIGFFFNGGHIELVIESWSYIPSGYVKIAIENGHRNRGFSQKKMVDLSIVMLIYQSVSLVGKLNSQFLGLPSQPLDSKKPMGLFHCHV